MLPRGPAVRAGDPGLSRGLGRAARRQPRRQAAALAVGLRRRRCGPWRSSPTSAAATICSGSTPPPACCGCSPASRSPPRSGSCSGIAIGLIPYVRRRAGAVRRRGLHGAAAGHPADPVHRAGPGRDREDHADRRSASRPIWSRDIAFRVAELPEELLIKAQTLGASTWQIGAAGGPAAAPAAPDLGPAPVARARPGCS